jgi:hypothetical protein
MHIDGTMVYVVGVGAVTVVLDLDEDRSGSTGDL